MVGLPILLPDVTLVLITGVASELGSFALDKTLKQITPANMIINSSDISSAAEADQYKWDVCANAGTSHTLEIQYDGWVLDGWCWQSQFLEFDYIGAPWPHENMTVGNGGFCLRSTRMMKFIKDHPERFPLAYPEDSTICLTYREALEAEGFKWAPTAVAHQFSWENCPKRRSLGFHGIHNVYKVLPKEELVEWVKMAPEYVRKKEEWERLGSQAHYQYGITI